VTYQFDVPAGKPSLNVAVQLRDHNYHLTGFLTDPTGMPRDVQSTAVIGPGVTLEDIGPTMQFFHKTPTAGRWTLSLLVGSPIDGAHLSEPFTARINFDRPVVATHGFPNSPSTVLPAGKPVNATINLTNTGNINKDFFADARLRGDKVLLDLLGADVVDVGLPLSLNAQPNWLVPPLTDQLIVGAQATVPFVLEVSAANGDPDVLGADLGSNFSLAVVAGAEVFPGFFFALPEPAGPFPARGIGKNAKVSLAALAETNAFDSAVTSDTGDVWQQAVDPEAAPYTPLTLRPGQSGTINVAFTPNAPSGTVVSGWVAIDTFNFDTFSGDELILLPYTYTVR
jgi:hypothetical protein